jgi:acetyltransferase-like isoleucine patch superfamily enzyme
MQPAYPPIPARDQYSFLQTSDVIEKHGTGNIFLAPDSVLISSGVTIGQNNVLYPNVVLERHGTAKFNIGSGNIFYPGVYFICSQGSLTIADTNEFMIGGCTVRANVPDAFIEIGSGGRYGGGVNILANASLGSGSQIFGYVTVQNCKLDGGGTFREPEPNRRGAVLKGFGTARNIHLGVGQVINGTGDFSTAPVEEQQAYHPPAARR